MGKPRCRGVIGGLAIVTWAGAGGGEAGAAAAAAAAEAAREGDVYAE